MKNFRKLVAVFVALVMCVGTASPAFAKDYDAGNGTVHVSGNESWQDENDKYDHEAKGDYEVNISGSTDKTVVEVEKDTSDKIQVSIDKVDADVKDGPAADIKGGSVDIKGGSVDIKDSTLSTEDKNSAAVEIGGDADVTVSGDTTISGSGTGIEMSGSSSLTVENGGNLEVNGGKSEITGDEDTTTPDTEGGNTGIDMEDKSSLTVEKGGELEANGSSVNVNNAGKETYVAGGNTGLSMKDSSTVTMESGSKNTLSGTVVSNPGKDPAVEVDSEDNKALDMTDHSQLALAQNSKVSAMDTRTAKEVSGESFKQFTSSKRYYGTTYTTYFYPNIDPHTQYGDDCFRVGASGKVTNIEMKVGDSANLDRQPIVGYRHNCGTEYEYNPTNYAGMNMTLGTSGVVELDKYAARDTGELFKGLQAVFSGAMPGETTVELDYYSNYQIREQSGYCSCGRWITLPKDYYWYSYKVEANVKVTANYELDYDLGDLTAAKLPEGVTADDLKQTSTVARTLESFDVTGTEPTREGYDFQGWGLKDANGNWVTDSEGKVILYKDGDSVTLQWAEGLGGDGNPVKLTLVANWKETAPEPDPDDSNKDPDDPNKDPDDPNKDPDDPNKDPDDPNKDPDGPRPNPRPKEPAVPDSDVPLAELPEEEVPQAELPEEEPEEVEIPEEEIPLSEIPKTGDSSFLWLCAALLSGAALLLLRKRDQEAEEA